MLQKKCCPRCSRRCSYPHRPAVRFDQFVISNKAKAVIEVTIEDGQTIYKLDGKVVKNHVLTVSGEKVAFLVF